MKRTRPIKAVLGALALACLALGLLAPTSPAASAEPLFVYHPTPQPHPPPQIPPPAGQLEGPCGLAVDAGGGFYVADYYHHAIDAYSPGLDYLTQVAGEDPLDGPCGLAVGPAANLYVNNYHRNVVRFGTKASFGGGVTIAGVGVDGSHPTGVAVDGSGTVYVDERDHLAVFDAAGLAGEPIGVGSLTDGYGVAVSAYPPTAGFLYVPDAAGETVKVYDPAAGRDDPVAEIDGSGTPAGHFTSLRDAAVAVDDASGVLYVVDDLTPELKEGHEAVVYAFDSTGAYLGRLKYAIQTVLPAGLAVDNSPTATQGRVYVTSGYTELAQVYVYPPNAQGSAAVALPGPFPTGGGAAAVEPPAPSPGAPAALSPATSEAVDDVGAALGAAPHARAHRGRAKGTRHRRGKKRRAHKPHHHSPGKARR